MKPILLVALLMTVAFAGCADSESSPDAEGTLSGAIDTEAFKLKTGTGAINGLLVDDRFRPIQLIDDPITEFQTTGFILIQETGQRVQTDANGHFAVVDLAPGRYTLRATAAGHEASPVGVNVVEALFAEATLLARRVSTLGGSVLTQEYTVFVPCAFMVGANVLIGNCWDSSFQQDRRGISGVNWTRHKDLSHVAVETKMDNPEAAWRIQVREDDGSSGGGARYMIMTADPATGYARAVMMKNETEVYDETTNPSPWNNTKLVDVLPFPMKGQVPTAGEWAQVPGGREAQCQTINGAIAATGQSLNCAHMAWAGGPAQTYDTGIHTASRGQFIVSLFLGEPDVDLATYQLMAV